MLMQENKFEQIEYLFFIKNDLKSAQQKLEIIFDIFIKELPKNKKMGNKHNCNRSENCDCIRLGIFLIEININTKKSPDLLKILDKYYYNPGINLPYKLFKFLCKNMIKLLDFQNVRSLIENYLTYSIIKENNLHEINKKVSSQGYEIELYQYEDLNNILIFDVILVHSGFNRAKAKITGIKDGNLKQIFFDKFNKLLFAYTNNIELNMISNFINDTENNNQSENPYSKLTKYDPQLYENINNIIDTKLNKNFLFENIFSNYIVKNSILQKIIPIILNKKFLISAFTIVILIIIRKIIKQKKIDIKILNYLIKLTVFLKQFKLFSAIQSFGSGIFKLLVNY